MKDVLIIIQARMGSTRLPGKVLMDLGGKTVLERVYETCESVAATKVIFPIHDEALTHFTPQTKMKFFAVNCEEGDVLERYYIADQCEHYLEYKHIVRITADCPFISADLIRIAVAAHKSHNAEYTRFNPIVSGLDVEVFTRYALDTAHRVATEDYDREHVTPWMRRNLKVHEIKKLSLDTQEDLDYLRRIEDALH